MNIPGMKTSFEPPTILFDETTNLTYDNIATLLGSPNLNCPNLLSSITNEPTTTESFPIEFQEYNRESYEQASVSPNRKRSRQSQSEESESSSEVGDDGTSSNVSNAEIRRQIHIQSEQKRRAQIKDGFEELKRHIPNCSNKKISKATILKKTVQHLEQVKEVELALTTQLQQMKAENEKLRRFYEMVAHEKAYNIGL
ncbi:hypothetical protein K7432_005859 [Basidiobolus ranarum]|uniref:BHLH domain-containing protein n=1 Tax=Basidiobolus ranarum TaxID=34480 RepID=A0ABR2WVS9_9FUNG